ncbi:hypothetical protein GGF50DRAFT_121941 [Schizophyllum commune]
MDLRHAPQRRGHRLRAAPLVGGRPQTRYTGETLVGGDDKADEEEKAEKDQEKKRLGSDLETKEDMERFYIALMRKLYDDGL